jgi:hypothetical protein
MSRMGEDWLDAGLSRERGLPWASKCINHVCQVTHLKIKIKLAFFIEVDAASCNRRYFRFAYCASHYSLYIVDIQNISGSSLNKHWRGTFI